MYTSVASPFPLINMFGMGIYGERLFRDGRFHVSSVPADGPLRRPGRTAGSPAFSTPGTRHGPGVWPSKATAWFSVPAAVWAGLGVAALMPTNLEPAMTIAPLARHPGVSHGTIRTAVAEPGTPALELQGGRFPRHRRAGADRARRARPGRNRTAPPRLRPAHHRRARAPPPTPRPRPGARRRRGGPGQREAPARTRTASTCMPRYLLRDPAKGPLASGPGMTVAPYRRHDNAVASSGRAIAGSG